MQDLDVSMGVCVADDVVCTSEDIAAVRELFGEKDQTLGRGLRVLRTPEAFPELYTYDAADKKKQYVHPDGRKYRPFIFDPKDGSQKTDETRWYKRGKERYFVGSTRWPDGLVIGMTYIETADVAGSRKYTFTDAVGDVPKHEIDRLKDLARGDHSYTEQDKLRRHAQQERRRAASKEANLDPEAQMTSAASRVLGEAIKLGAFNQPAAPEGPSASELEKKGLRWDALKGELVAITKGNPAK